MYQQVLSFWFDEIDSSQWWVKDPELDRLIADRFLDLHHKAVACELFSWRAQPEGRLAEVIVLDQFSRNIYRDSPLSFANDALALALVQEAVSLGIDQQLSCTQRSVFYLPMMHSESPLIHQQAVPLYEANGDQGPLEFELKHKAIIDRFGRYPHRNKIVGRVSTKEEKAFLLQPGSGF